MSDFKPLYLPEQEIGGEHKGKWYVPAGVNGYLQSDGSSVTQANWHDENNDGLYFDNECRAHEAAASYHMHYYQPYPYDSEWMLAVNDLAASLTKPTEIESEVMEF